MIRRGHWLVLLLVGALAVPASVTTAGAAGPRPAAAESAGAVGHVYLEGDEGDYVTQGERRVWDAAEVTVRPHPWDPDGIEVSAVDSRSGLPWQLSFVPQAGTTLAAGQVWSAGSIPAQFLGGLEVTGDARSCGRKTGRFRVLELAPDLSRVWILFEYQCASVGRDSDGWGEIRLGIGDDATPTAVVDTGRRLGRAAPGSTAAAGQPVRVVNGGSTPVAVSPVVVEGGADFAVEGTDCAVVAPLDSCEVRLAFAPTLTGVRRGVLRVAAGEQVHDVALVGLGSPGSTGFVVRAHGPEPLTSGLGAAGVGDGSVALVPSGHLRLVLGDLTLSLVGPSQVLESGQRFVDDGGQPRPAVPGRAGRTDLALSRDGLVCDGRGWVELDEVFQEDDEDLPSSFTGTFAHHCGSWVTGSFSVRSDPPGPASAEPDAAPSGPARPPAVTWAFEPAAYLGRDQRIVRVGLTHAGSERLVLAARSQGVSREVGFSDTGARSWAWSWPVARTTTFELTLGRHRFTRRVEVRAQLSLGQPRRLTSAPGRSRVRFALPVRTAPVPLTGGCVRLQVQDRLAGRWRARTSRCLGLDAAGRATPRLSLDRGRAARVRLVWAGSRDVAEASTPWRALRAPRRR